jgi:hypothetical protein
MANPHTKNEWLYSGADGTKHRTNMPMGNLSGSHICFFDDFTGVTHDATNDWTVVKDSGASVALAADIFGGELDLLSAATTDADGASIQGNQIWKASDKKFWWEAKFSVHDADDTDFFIGLCVNFATNPEACLTAADRIGFQVTEGSANLLCKTEESGNETSTDSGTDVEDDTMITCQIYFDGGAAGSGNVYYFVNGKQVAVDSGTEIPDDVTMALAAMSVSGSATGTFISSVDYIRMVQER